MNEQPVVSIIMPCYNDGQYLQQAISSCLQQTFQSIELIIVDDGSDDDCTISTLKTLLDPRITILHANHIGPSGARNTAIQHAKGRYILPLDADDWIDPKYIEHAVKILDARADVGIVYCRAYLFGEKEGIWHLPEYSLENILLDNCIFITALFRKADWQTVGGFSEEFNHGLEDYDFWLSLIERGRTVYQFPDVWFHYRIKKSSRSTQMVSSIDQTTATYKLLYQRHKGLYMQHIDEYILGLRRALIEQKMLHGNNAAQGADPVAEYWQTLRLLKPKIAKRIESLLPIKDKIKRWLHR